MTKRRFFALALASSILVLCFTFSSFAQTSFNPPSSSSSKGVLDLLLIARPEVVHLDKFSPTGWIYEACYTSVAVSDQCPADPRTVATYRGVVLQLQPW